MLRIVTGLAPDHRRGPERGRAAIELHVLAIALHLELLQIGGQSREPRVVRQHRQRGQACWWCPFPPIRAVRRGGGNRRGGGWEGSPRGGGGPRKMVFQAPRHPR